MTTIKTTELKPGMVVRVHQKIKEKSAKSKDKDRERIQIFEGMIIARKGGSTPGSSFTVRKLSANEIWVEKIFPIYLPSIEKVELVKQTKARRAKLYYLRNYKKKLKELK